MDWNAIAAIGELVGAAAVVVSLLYVGRELKHSSTVARVQGTPYLCELWPRLRPSFPEDYAAWLEGRYNVPARSPDQA